MPHSNASNRQFRHPILGRFKVDQYGQYVQRRRIAGRQVELEVACTEDDFSNCAKLASKILARLECDLDAVADFAARHRLWLCNQIRTVEGKPPLTREGFAKRLKLFAITVSRGIGTVTFTANSYDDEHNFVQVEIGPRGGMKDVWID